MPAQLEQPVAMRRMVAVETPHAALGGRAADPGGAQPPDDRAVDRLAVVKCGLRGVNHELLRQRQVGWRQTSLVGDRLGLRHRWRAAEQFAVPLADADALEGQQGLAEQAAELG